MTMSTPLQRSRTAAGFSLLFLMTLALATTALLVPGAALAAENFDGRDQGQDGPGGPGGGPGAGTPGNGANGAPVAEITGVTGGGNATTTSDVNLRSGPSLESDVITIVPRGSTVQIVGGGQAGFVPVVFNGMSGFMSGDYLGGGGTAQTAAPTEQSAAQTAQASAPAAAVTNGSLPVVIATDAVVADDAARNPEMVAIIYAAADAYGQSREDMLRVAACESNLDPGAVNEAGGSYGLFQFLPSTWASTPFADQDIFDAVASANAAAWMWSVGRRGEWVCQ